MTKELPKGILKTDLVRPRYDDKDGLTGSWENSEFQLWLISGFGWVIPTLSIARHGQRTYAVALAEGNDNRRIVRGAQVRCGRGPHVLEQHVVYVRKSRAKVLEPFLELRKQGAIGANVTRDRISSRRAQGSLERAQGHSSWKWNV